MDPNIWLADRKPGRSMESKPETQSREVKVTHSHCSRLARCKDKHLSYSLGPVCHTTLGYLSSNGRKRMHRCSAIALQHAVCNNSLAANGTESSGVGCLGITQQAHS